MHPSPAGVCNSKDTWPISRAKKLAKAVWVTDLNSWEHDLLPATSRVVNEDELGIAKISILVTCAKNMLETSLAWVRKSWRQKKKQWRDILNRLGLQYARSKQLILRFKGVWNIFVHVRAYAFGVDLGSNLLAVSCGFFDDISHPISLAWKAVMILERALGSSFAWRPGQRWERHRFRERGWLWKSSLLSILDEIVTYHNYFNKELEWFRRHCAHPTLERSNLTLSLLSMSEFVLLTAVSFGSFQMGFFKAIPSSDWSLN